MSFLDRFRWKTPGLVSEMPDAVTLQQMLCDAEVAAAALPMLDLVGSCGTCEDSRSRSSVSLAADQVMPS